MNDLFVFAAHNTVVALVFALFVYGLTRASAQSAGRPRALAAGSSQARGSAGHARRPGSALRLPGSTHASGQIIADVLRIERQQAESHPRFVDRPTAPTTAQASATSVKEYDFAASLRLFWNRGRPVLLWFWLGGAALCAGRRDANCAFRAPLTRHAAGVGAVATTRV